MGNAPNNAWERFKGDFNSMTDEEIEQVTKEAQDTIDREEEWVEAVSSWKAAGKPRRKDAKRAGFEYPAPKAPD